MANSFDTTKQQALRKKLNEKVDSGNSNETAETDDIKS
jgi:hypothetical protein